MQIIARLLLVAQAFFGTSVASPVQRNEAVLASLPAVNLTATPDLQLQKRHYSRVTCGSGKMCSTGWFFGTKDYEIEAMKPMIDSIDDDGYFEERRGIACAGNKCAYIKNLDCPELDGL